MSSCPVAAHSPSSIDHFTSFVAMSKAVKPPPNVDMTSSGSSSRATSVQSCVGSDGKVVVGDEIRCGGYDFAILSGVIYAFCVYLIG